MSRERADKLILAAEAAYALEIGRNSAQFPTRESHVRELLKLETDEQRAVGYDAATCK